MVHQSSCRHHTEFKRLSTVISGMQCLWSRASAVTYKVAIIDFSGLMSANDPEDLMVNVPGMRKLGSNLAVFELPEV